MIPAWFSIYYQGLERVAQRFGWCLTIHGSMQRDLDLVLLPWTDDAEPETKVLEAVEKFIKGGPYYKKSTKNSIGLHATEKPHGRKAYIIYIGHSNYYLDISVFPRIIEDKK